MLRTFLWWVYDGSDRQFYVDQMRDVLGTTQEDDYARVDTLKRKRALATTAGPCEPLASAGACETTR